MRDRTTEYKISKKQQLKELIDRIPPVLNVNIVIFNKGKYLIGRRNNHSAIFKKKFPDPTILPFQHYWLFPGGRMKYTEIPQETAVRILKTEVPGINATLKKFITFGGYHRVDPRAYGVDLYFLFEYKEGKTEPNEHFDKYLWLSLDELKEQNYLHPGNKALVDEIDQIVRSMNISQEELLVEVDKNDKEIGEIVKQIAHSDPKRYHRAAHIMLFNSKGNLMLQQRSWRQTSSPGAWDMPGGHQALGMTIEQTAKQELAEEMGVTPKINFMRKGLYNDKKQSEWYYLYYCVSDGPYGFDRNEVEMIKEFDCEKLLAGMYDSKYQILDHVKRYTKELEKIWEKLK